MMTSNGILTTYESLSELTGSMLDAARLGEWDQLAELEQQCKAHVGNLMQSTQVRLNEKEQRSKIAIIRSILQNDAKIRALTEPHMHELQQQLHMTRTGQRGVHAYGAQRA
jgi:flagellar protein FliT